MEGRRKRWGRGRQGPSGTMPGLPAAISTLLRDGGFPGGPAVLRTHLPTQETRSPALVQEAPTRRGATKPRGRHYHRASTPEPGSHNCQAPVPRACACSKRPLKRKAVHRAWRQLSTAVRTQRSRSRDEQASRDKGERALHLRRAPGSGWAQASAASSAKTETQTGLSETVAGHTSTVPAAGPRPRLDSSERGLLLPELLRRLQDADSSLSSRWGSPVLKGLEASAQAHARRLLRVQRGSRPVGSRSVQQGGGGEAF